MTETKFDKDVQGAALYYELRKAGSTCQILITPDGFSKLGDKIVPAQFFRRVLRLEETKRKWRAYGFRITPEQKSALTYGQVMPEDEVARVTHERFKQLESYFDSLVSNGYTLAKDTPIYVEVTKEDLDSINSGSMPAKLWTRVKASRTALGFPETVVDPLATTI